MQENLDVIISLVVVIIGLAMLVQLVTEFVKNLLKIRWGVYESFIKDIYRQFFYGQANFLEEKNEENNGNTVKRIVKKIFHSISTFFGTSWKGKKIGSTRQRLMGLHDKIVSLAEAATELEQQLIKFRYHIENQTYEQCPQILEPIIGRLKKNRLIIQTTNIGELFKIYIKNAKGEELKIFDNYAGLFNQLDEKLQNFRSINQKETKKVLDKLIIEIQKIEKFLVSYKAKITDHIDIWLEDLENRYSQKLAFWSFLIGLIVVFSLNADAITIFRNLRDHPALRQNLIQQSDILTQQVSSLSIQNNINQLSKSGNDFKIALKEQSALDEKACNQFLSEYKLLQDTIVNSANSFNAIYKGVNQSEQVLLELPHVPLDKETGALKPVTVNAEICAENNSLKKEDIQKIKPIIEKSIIELQENYRYLQTEVISGQKKILYSTGLPLGWNRQLLNEAFQNSYNVAKKIFGLLITTVLITLGAPFWNDLLTALLGVKNFLRKSESS